MQKVLNQLDELITWSRMKFKAKKSRSVTFHKGKQKQHKFTIAGEQMPTIKEEPVKSLGRWYAGTLSDRSRGVEVMKQAEDGLKAIDRTKLPGKHKICACSLHSTRDWHGLCQCMKSPCQELR